MEARQINSTGFTGCLPPHLQFAATGERLVLVGGGRGSRYKEPLWLEGADAELRNYISRDSPTIVAASSRINKILQVIWVGEGIAWASA